MRETSAMQRFKICPMENSAQDMRATFLRDILTQTVDKLYAFYEEWEFVQSHRRHSFEAMIMEGQNSRKTEWFFAMFFTVASLVLDIAMFITTPIYILVIITLWKYRKEDTLKHAFFKLMISTGISDVGKILSIFFINRLAAWGWIPQVFIWLGGMSSRLYYIFSYFFGTSQGLGVLIVAFNRYTAYMMPLQHQKLWRDGAFVIWLIVGIWVISFLSITPVMFIFEYKIYISPDDNRTIYLQWSDANALLYYSIPVTMVSRGLIVLIVFIIYGTIFVTVFKSKRQATHERTAAEKSALNMSIIGFAHCIGLAIAVYFFIAEEISWFGFGTNLLPVEIINFINNLGYDLFSAINPYALLICSKAVRQHFLKLCPRFISDCFSPKKNVIFVTERSKTAARVDEQMEL